MLRPIVFDNHCLFKKPEYNSTFDCIFELCITMPAELENQPFGSPDGAAEDAGSFVNFQDIGRWRDLALRDGDRRARILVGRRGSGKSRYLRKLQISIRDEKLLDYAQRDTKISLRHLTWLHKVFPERAARLEAWENLWQCAIYAGLATFLLYNSSCSPLPISDEHRAFLEKSRLVPEGPKDMPIVAVLNDILLRYGDRSRLELYLADPNWHAIEGLVLEALGSLPAIFCFIDALDDNYAEAPVESTDAQLGLINWIMRKVSDASVTNRLHVVVTVRDVFYAALLDSDNGQRYNDRLHIRCLDWDEHSSSYYLQQKIALLNRAFCVNPDGAIDAPMKRWLGFERIRNVKRGGIEERVEEYILRHTRFLPREINELGNRISQQIRLAKSGRERLDPESVSRTIASTARNFARDIIKEVAYHLAALDGVRGPAEADGRLSREGEYRRMMTEAVDKFLRSLVTEKFSAKDLREAENAFWTDIPWWSAQVAGQEILVQDVLWQHGLIGYRKGGDREQWVRYFNSAVWADGDLSARLPKVEHYYLHSALLDIYSPVIEPLPPIAHAN